MQFRQYLNLPFYHFQTKNEKWLYILSCSLFFMLFLLVYQPFGISAVLESGEHTIGEFLVLVVALGFIVFFALYISQFFLRVRFFKSDITTDLRYFLKWFLIDISLIVFLNSIIEFSLFEDDIITINNFMREVVLDIIFSFITLIIVLFYPVLGSLAYVNLKQLHSDKQQLKTDLDILTTHYKIASGNEELLKIFDEKGDCKLTVPLNNLYAIESRNQYISIKYKRNDQLVEQSVRTPFSKVLHQLQDIPTIQKCHRSYAVNLLNVKELKRIDQKPNLILDEVSVLKVPVSKTYLKDIKSELSKY